MLDITLLRKHNHNLINNQTKITNPNSSFQLKYYNAMNQLEKETDVLGNSTIYGYNSLGQLVTAKDQKNVITSYTYDGYGNLYTTSINGKQINNDLFINLYANRTFNDGKIFESYFSG